MSNEDSQPDIGAETIRDSWSDSTTSPRLMQVSGFIVFVAVLVLMSFVIPPLFDTDVAGGGSSGVHTPPASIPAGDHGPPTSGGG